jgi:hypothetical protein
VLLPLRYQLEPADDPEMDLPSELYFAQREFIDCIIARGCQEVAQVYTIRRYYDYKQVGIPDYIVLISIDIINNWGNMLAGLIESSLLDSSKAGLCW